MVEIPPIKMAILGMVFYWVYHIGEDVVCLEIGAMNH
jgi:hypothetical protein